MNREIKFRGKRLDNGDWIYGDLQIGDDDHIPMIGTVGPGRWVEYIQVDENTIGQFTGLRDDMGVEIFEGDILRVLNIRKSIYEQKDEYVYGSVLFQQGEYLIKTKDRIATFVRTVADNLCEVFGNIHDNMEF